VEPGDGAFDDPAEDAQAGTLRLAAFGDERSDASLPEQTPVLVVVVAAVGQQRIQPPAWTADPAGDGGTLSSRDSSWVTSLRLPPVRDTESGMPA
jgi:hypothetical protein